MRRVLGGFFADFPGKRISGGWFPSGERFFDRPGKSFRPGKGFFFGFSGKRDFQKAFSRVFIVRGKVFCPGIGGNAIFRAENGRNRAGDDNLAHVL